MIRVATDRSCWRDDVPVAPMLQPLLGAISHRDDATAWDRRFDHYAAVAGSMFELTTVAAADVVVLPGDWYWVRGTSWRSRPDASLASMTRPLYERAREEGKPVVMFYSGDRSCDRVPYPDAHVFREGPFGSRSGLRDRPLPAFSEDLVEQYCKGTVVERSKSTRPTVGFCGLASTKSTIRRGLGNLAYYPMVLARERRIDPSPHVGEQLRARVLRLLEHSPRVETNFILRDSKVFFRSGESRHLLDVRRDYVRNMADSDYVLCIRGSGNYSYRLYEAMCMGRIPVIVNTDLQLPCGDEIAWKELTVWVEEDDIESLPERLSTFHDGLSAIAFADLQHTMRRHWVQSLSPQGFFGHLSRVDPSTLR